MTNKTRKNHKINSQRLINAKKGALDKCRIKTFRSKMYQNVFGMTTGGSIRSTRQLFY